MDQLPGIASWPIIRHIIWLFSIILNGIFDLLQSIGIVNVALAIVLFSFIVQLFFLPFNIRSGLKATKNQNKQKALDQLREEYKDKLDDPAELAAYQEKQKEIQGTGKQKKGSGCLLTILQFTLLFCVLSTLIYMNQLVDVLAAMDANALANAYTVFGIDLSKAATTAWWPNVLVPIAYVALYCVPNIIRQYIAGKKEKKKWLEEMTEEELEMLEEEGKKKDGLTVAMSLLKLINPIAVFVISVRVPGYFVVYWLANIIWRKVNLNSARFLYRGVWPRVKVGIGNIIEKLKKKEGHDFEGN